MHSFKGQLALKDFQIRDHINYPFNNKDIKLIKFDNAYS